VLRPDSSSPRPDSRRCGRAAVSTGGAFGGPAGATAVEFALVAVPVPALIFAVIETALAFWSTTALDTACGRVAPHLHRAFQQANATTAPASFRPSSATKCARTSWRCSAAPTSRPTCASTPGSPGRRSGPGHGQPAVRLAPISDSTQAGSGPDRGRARRCRDPGLRQPAEPASDQPGERQPADHGGRGVPHRAVRDHRR
jgi:hypothetical protein